MRRRDILRGQSCEVGYRSLLPGELTIASSRVYRFAAATESGTNSSRSLSCAGMMNSIGSEAPLPAGVVLVAGLLDPLEHEGAERQQVELGLHHGRVGVLGRAHDRLATQVEAGVEQHRAAGQALE